jgi:hypothetical protein
MPGWRVPQAPEGVPLPGPGDVLFVNHTLQDEETGMIYMVCSFWSWFGDHYHHRDQLVLTYQYWGFPTPSPSVWIAVNPQ